MSEPLVVGRITQLINDMPDAELFALLRARGFDVRTEVLPVGMEGATQEEYERIKTAKREEYDKKAKDLTSWAEAGASDVEGQMNVPPAREDAMSEPQTETQRKERLDRAIGLTFGQSFSRKSDSRPTESDASDGLLMALSAEKAANEKIDTKPASSVEYRHQYAADGIVYQAAFVKPAGQYENRKDKAREIVFGVLCVLNSLEDDEYAPDPKHAAKEVVNALEKADLLSFDNTPKCEDEKDE